MTAIDEKGQRQIGRYMAYGFELARQNAWKVTFKQLTEDELDEMVEEHLWTLYGRKTSKSDMAVEGTAQAIGQTIEIIWRCYKEEKRKILSADNLKRRVRQ